MRCQTYSRRLVFRRETPPVAVLPAPLRQSLPSFAGAPVPKPDLAKIGTTGPVLQVGDEPRD
jgi:hypothetical protein